MLFLVFLIIAAVAAEYWSLGHALDGVSHAYAPDRSLAEPGEVFLLRSELVNASRRFVPFLKLEESVPEELTLSEGEDLLQQTSAGKKLSDRIFLLPRQKWERSLPVSLPARGRYIFRGVSMAGGDFLGLKETGNTYSEFSEIVVVPARLERADLDLALGSYLGDRSVRRFLLEDPVLTVGFSPYTGREPMKSISWPRSLVSGELMVKNFDHTTQLCANVFLCVRRGQSDEDAQRTEACFSLARTVCETLEEKKLKYRFLTNADTAGAFSLWDCVDDGLGSSHLQTILEGLGRATHEPAKPFQRVLESALHRSAEGRMNVFIFPESCLAEDGPDGFRGQIRLLERCCGCQSLILTPDGAQESARKEAAV